MFHNKNKTYNGNQYNQYFFIVRLYHSQIVSKCLNQYLPQASVTFYVVPLHIFSIASFITLFIFQEFADQGGSHKCLQSRSAESKAKRMMWSASTPLSNNDDKTDYSVNRIFHIDEYQ